MCSPLELVYNGWVIDRKVPLGVCTWVEQVQETMELAREVAVQSLKREFGNRKEHYDSEMAVRLLSEGDLVWHRLPWMDHKLKEGWLRPLVVVNTLNAINYWVKEYTQKGRPKVVHVNVLKRCVERNESVRKLMLAAEEIE